MWECDNWKADKIMKLQAESVQEVSKIQAKTNKKSVQDMKNKNRKEWEKEFDNKNIVRLKNPIDGEIYIREKWVKQFISSLQAKTISDLNKKLDEILKEIK